MDGGKLRRADKTDLLSLCCGGIVILRGTADSVCGLSTAQFRMDGG
ncbi:MAG: hypothetical protein ACTTKL_10235 [Treponema sp.]